MKAVIVTPYYSPKIGGLEMYAQQLNIALKQRKKWDIVIVTSNHEGRKTVIEELDGMKVYRLGRWLKFSNTPLNPLWPLMMKRIFRREKPDVILAHTPVPSLADAARMAAGKTPLFVFYHAATLLKGDSIVFDAIARGYQIYERALLGRAARIFPVSEFVKEQLPARYAPKARVVPNAVWSQQISSRTQPDEVNFLFVGSLDRTHAWKGLELIIKAIAECRHRRDCSYTLTVMGDGDHRAYYEQLVKDLDLRDIVTFMGNQRGGAKEVSFARAYALIMYPTSANDAFPTVMLEAWARSVPVVAASIGPIPSLVNDRQDGFLVKPHDASALADMLCQMTQLPVSDREEIAQRAAQRVAAEYTWEKQADTVERYVREML